MRPPYVTGEQPDRTPGLNQTLESAKTLDRHLKAAIRDFAPQKGDTMSTPATPAPGSFAASLRAMVDDARAGIERARADGLAKVSDAVGELTKATVATTKVAEIAAQTIREQADAVMSELGQISNHPPE